MISDVFMNIREYLDDRIKSPLFGPFSAAWIVWNWKPILIIVASSQPIEQSIELVLKNYSNAHDQLWIPLGFAVLYAIINPWISILFGISQVKAAFLQKKEKISRETEILRLSLGKAQAQAQLNTILATDEITRGMRSDLESARAQLDSAKEHQQKMEDEAEAKRRELEDNYDKLQQSDRDKRDSEISKLEGDLAKERARVSQIQEALHKRQQELDERTSQTNLTANSAPIEISDDDLRSLLLSRPYRLVFNPKTHKSMRTAQDKGSKRIVFGLNGEILEGSNDNEHRWTIAGGLLELLRADGRIQSRFRYDPILERFLHTNDSDTLSLPFQYIVPDSLPAFPGTK